MKIRPAAALAVVLAATATASANAAVKPVCKLVKDGTSDTFVARTAQDPNPPAPKTFGPQEDGFDITSADIAATTKTVTAVVRVKRLAAAIQSSPTGVAFAFDFTLPASTDITGTLRAVYVTNQPAYYEATWKDASIPNSPSTFLGLGTGSFDTRKNEVHISAPASLFTSALGAIRNGTRLTPAEFASATSGRPVPPSPGQAGKPVASRFVFADAADGGTAYKVGTKSCVTPGR